MNIIFNIKSRTPQLLFARFGHRLRGKPPGLAKTLAQRLAEENEQDPELHKQHDIGFPHLRLSRTTELKQRLAHVKNQRKNLDLERLARQKQLDINLEETKQEWLKTAGPFHIRKIAEHYGVFEHLFGKFAYFTPRVSLNINFPQPDETLVPVYHGNRVKPYEAENAPEVTFNHKFSISGEQSAAESSLWTLILTNPDGNLTEPDKEYVHWMIGNIPEGDVSKGDLIVPYLQPISPKGTGYHRHIFVLYKQEKSIDFDQLRVKNPFDLASRTFSSYEFYKKHQDFITPAGLSFLQADWDDTLTGFYHNVLKMKEPHFDYDYPEAYLKDEVTFPHRQAFNLYMDRYADPKEVNKRFLLEKLAKVHPFEGPEPPMRFPNAHFLGDEPSWLKTEIRKKRLRVGRVADVESH